MKWSGMFKVESKFGNGMAHSMENQKQRMEVLGTKCNGLSEGGIIWTRKEWSGTEWSAW